LDEKEEGDAFEEGWKLRTHEVTGNYRVVLDRTVFRGFDEAPPGGLQK
jgi:hypothetical protein